MKIRPGLFFLVMALFSVTASAYAQPAEKVVDENVCLSAYEAVLLKQMQAYRQSRKLPEIALSADLCEVAQAHVRDLSEHRPYNNRCNLHSWSAYGEWTACCYTSDHRKAACMWNKPKELTDYTGEGYEVAFWTSESGLNPEVFASRALNAWKGSRGHNETIINLGRWRQVKWNAIGVGIYNGYAVVWFGEKTDDEVPVFCDGYQP